MKRIINLVTSDTRISIPNVDSIDISRLDNTVNCSIDTIFGYIFEYITASDFTKYFPLVLNKLRPDGSIVLRLTNYKKICDLYYKNELTDQEFLSVIQSKKNILSVDQILSSLDSKFILNKIDYIENYIVIAIQRKNL